MSLCNLGNLFWPFLNVDKLDTRLGWNLRVGFDIKEGVNYSDFTSCLCVCLNVCLCYQGLRFLCYVSCVMFQCYVSCYMFPVGLIICDQRIWILAYDCGDVGLWSYSFGLLVNNHDWWRVSDVLIVTCIINLYFLFFFFIIFIIC